eukprot:5299542-Pleurochrysis_carterae.AAC.2
MRCTRTTCARRTRIAADNDANARVSATPKTSVSAGQAGKSSHDPEYHHISTRKTFVPPVYQPQRHKIQSSETSAEITQALPPTPDRAQQNISTTAWLLIAVSAALVVFTVGHLNALEGFEGLQQLPEIGIGVFEVYERSIRDTPTTLDAS